MINLNLLVSTRVCSAVKDTQDLSHIDLATEILVALYDSDHTRMLYIANPCFTNQQKSLCQRLGQLIKPKMNWFLTYPARPLMNGGNSWMDLESP